MMGRCGGNGCDGSSNDGYVKMVGMVMKNVMRVSCVVLALVVVLTMVVVAMVVVVVVMQKREPYR